MSYKHITIGGDLGSGKSTVGKILCQKLGFTAYSTGAIQRQFSQKMGISTLELNKNISRYPEIDQFIDNSLLALNDSPEHYVVDSRMAWHFVKDAFKVFITCNIDVAAARIYGANRETEHQSGIEQTKDAIIVRKRCEEQRYLELYKVNISNKDNYDLVIDSTAKSPEEIAQIIIDKFTQQK